MADDNQNIAITLTASDDGATAVIADVRAQIAGIEQELQQLSSTGSSSWSGLSAGAKEAATGVTAATNATKEARGVFSEVNSIGGDLARAMSSVGLASGEAAGRIGALAGALGSLKEAAPELIAIVTVITTIIGAFEFLRSASDSASAVDNAMEELRIRVEAAGGSFSAMEPHVREWADALADLTGVVQEKSIPAVLQLVDAGQSVDGAMTEVTIATQAVAAGMGMVRGGADEASSSSQRFQLIMRALVEAEDGHYQMLERIDPKLKTLIDGHATLGQVIEKLNEDTKNAITANNSSASAWDRLWGIIGTVKDRIGKEMLPMLGDLAMGLYAVVDTFGHVYSAAEEWEQGVAQAFAGGAAAAVDSAKAIKDAFSGNFAAAGSDLKRAEGDIVGSAHGIGTAFQGMGKSLYDVFHPVVGTVTDLTNDLKTLQKQAADTASIVNPDIAGKAGKGPKSPRAGGAGFTPSETLIAPEETNASTSALNEYHTALLAVQDASKALSTTVDTSMTTDKEKAEHLAQLAQASAQARTEMASLIPTIQSERTEIAASTTTINEKYQALKNATNALNELTQHEGASKTAIAAAREEQRLAAAEYHNATTGLSALTSELTKHVEQLSKDTKAVQDNTKAQDDLYKQYNDAVEKANQMLADEKATYDRSIAQQIAYWNQRLEIARAGGEAQLSDAAEIYQKITDLEKQAFEQQINAQKQALETESKDMSTFLSDIIVDNKSFADALKSVYDGILKSWIDTISQMVVQSKPFQSIMSEFGVGKSGGIFGGSQQGLGSLSTAGSQLSTAGTQLTTSATQLGTAATQGTTAATQTTSAAAQLESAAAQLEAAATALEQAAAAVQSAGAGGGGGGGISSLLSAFGSGNSNDSVYNVDPNGAMEIPYTTWTPSGPAGNVYIAGLDGPTVASDSAAGAGAAGGAASALSTGLGGAFMGFGMGSGIAGMMGENTTWGGVGGALGGAAGSIFGGPVGGMIGSLLGGLIGGLFGNHETPGEMPDVSEPVVGGVDYGQFVANFTGAPGSFNGQTINPQAGYLGNPEAVTLAQDLKNLGNNVPKSLQPLVDQLKALEGGNGPTLGLGIKSESQGMFTLDSGKQISVTDYMQLVSSFMNQTASMVPTFSVTRTYPNYNQGTLKSTGEYLPSPTTEPAGSQQPPGTVIGGPSSPSKPNVTVMVNGSLIGPGSIDDVALAVSQALQRIERGIGPGGLTHRFGTQPGGGD